MPATPHLATALDDWRKVLGAEHVRLNDPASPTEGLRTFGNAVAVPATLFPVSAEEVSACLAIASRHGIGVHPVSRGCNWGLGSRAPNRAGDVIVDLSRLDAISGFNAHEGLVHVQPGVTFRQLFDFLATQDCDYFLPTIGGPVMASVLANALDRGDAVFCDRWRAISDLTVVLADGQVIETGHGADSPLAGRGIPPSGAIVDGLFSQSNFGIVTGAWLRLEPLPRNISAWMVHVGARDNLDGFVARWRELQRAGTLPDRSFILWNGIKFLARQGQRSNWSDEQIARAQLDDWYCSGFVTGESPAIVTARDDMVHRAIANTVAGAEYFTARSEQQWNEEARDIFATPRQTNLRTVYWRHHEAPALDDVNPDRDGCGLLWLCLAMPLDGAAIREFATWCHARLQQAGMDFNIGLEGANFRTALAYLTLTYERSPASDVAALECYDDLVHHAASLGFTPYRLANGISPTLDQTAQSRQAFLRTLRNAIDPRDTVASGKSGLTR